MTKPTAKPSKAPGRTKAKAKKAAKPKAAPSVRVKSAEGLGLEEKITGGELTPKQEAFCHAYVETSIASEAYRRAYNCANMKDETIWRNAHELLHHNSKVATRVAQLRESHRERHEYTVDDLIAELEEAREVAKKAESAAPMVAATMGKGKLLGLIIDKAEHTGKDGKDLIPPDPSSRDVARAVLDILRQAKMEGQPYDPHLIEGELDDDDEIEPGLVSASPAIAAPAVNGASTAGIADLPRVRVFNPTSQRLE